MSDTNQNPETDGEEKPQAYLSKEGIKEMLRTEQRFQHYFEGFIPYSVKSFIDYYGTHREMWWKYGKMYVEMVEREDTRWLSAAAAHLKIIQQKKLFDAQCLWRAEQANYQGVKICFDFQVWEHDVLNCPFLEPISEEEVALYTQYLGQNNVDVDHRGLAWDEWQNYHEIKEAYASENGNRNFPEWYDFHNGRTGTGVLMSLPDIRGEKEEYYIDLVREQTRAENQGKWDAAEQARDKRPSLNYLEHDQMEYFIRTFDDAQTLEYFRAFSRHDRHRGWEEEIREITALLLRADEPVPIQGHHDFREALRLAAEQYQCRMIAAHLPIAHEEYLMNLSLGVRSPDTAANKETYESIRESYLQMILKGRRLSGGPEDPDF